MNYKKILCLFLLVGFVFLVNVTVKAAEDDREYHNYESELVSCGATSSGKAPLISGIPKSIPNITRIIYLGIEIAVPVVLVIFGMLDLFKGISAQKEEEMKKGQNLFLKRILAAALVFLVMMIAKLLIGFASDSKAGKIVACMECFVEGKCE